MEVGRDEGGLEVGGEAKMMKVGRGRTQMIRGKGKDRK